MYTLIESMQKGEAVRGRETSNLFGEERFELKFIDESVSIGV